MARYNSTERIGVSAVESISASELNWIFREQMIADMGIDAHLELVEEGTPTGKLIALQIKTGHSHFKITDDHLVYYGSLEHREYWLNHSLPVVIIAHLPESKETCWALVNSENIELTPTKWKISIPRSNVFGNSTKPVLARVFEGNSAQQRMRRLAIDEPLMRHIKNGGKVSLALEDWINKSLGRSPVVVYVSGEDGDETIEQDFFVFYTNVDVEGLARSLFPWATPSVDQDFYDENHESFHDGSYASYLDEEDYEPGYITTSKIYPYAEACGEVEYYRLNLTLNEIGESFLTLSEYLARKNLDGIFSE